MRLLVLAAALSLAGCAASGTSQVAPAPLLSCASPEIGGQTFYPADDLGTPPAVVGGMRAVLANLDYPARERQRGVQGVVMVRFAFDAGGSVVCSDVVRGVSPALDEAARRAVHRATFEPVEVDGQPVGVVAEMPITFGLG